MKFTAEPMTIPITFEPGDTWSMSIKQPNAYRRMIESLRAYFEGWDDGTEVRLLNKSSEIIDLSKNILLIHDSYTFDVSARPIITALTKDLLNKSALDDSVILRLEQDILSVMGEIDLHSSHNLIYKSELNVADIVKMMGVKLAASEQHNLIDKMYSIIEIARNLLAKHLLIFVNHRCLINSEEFVGLADFAKHLGQSVLYIDNADSEMAKDERRMMIDDDLYCYVRSF